jgi:DNA polymerase III gamma/tau subunit
MPHPERLARWTRGLAGLGARIPSFLFSRPRLAELTKLLRFVADGEEIDVPDAALSLVARSSRGSFRDAVSTLDQLSAATDGKITVQAVLQLLGAVEEEALFRICDLIVDRDTAGLLSFVEELAEQGQDLSRLVTDLLEHLRCLLLVQHMGEVPESLPVTPETRERLHAQANQIGEADVIRLVDLLAVAVDDVRQGGDPRLPLELALVKVTRPGADLSRQSLSFRIEQLEGKVRGEPQHHQPEAAQPAPTAPAEPLPDLDIEQVQQVWGQAVLPALGERSIPTASVLGEARPVALSGNRLVIEFPPAASFHRNLAEEPKNATLLAEVLYEVTGHRLALAFAVGDGEVEAEEREAEGPASEDDIISLMKTTFDAREVDE